MRVLKNRSGWPSHGQRNPLGMDSAFAAEKGGHAPKVRIVPGITAFQAAARTGTVLCEGTESLRVVAGISDEEALTREMNDADTVVLVKVYRNAAAITGALRRAGRGSDCLLASCVEQPGERISRGMNGEDTPPYMSLVLSRKNND